MKIKILTVLMIMIYSFNGFSQDANFHIYLCLGQSNMEGNARIQPQDTIGVDKRFQVLEAVDCPNLGRVKGQWYTALPPLCRCKPD